MKKELLLSVFLSFFIALIDLGAQIRGVQTPVYRCQFWPQSIFEDCLIYFFVSLELGRILPTAFEKNIYRCFPRKKL